MTVDYDTRRVPADSEDAALDKLPGPSATVLGTRDVDEIDADSYEMPDADLSGEELMMQVIPKRADEFTCSSCFLVHHRSRLAARQNGSSICTDCA